MKRSILLMLLLALAAGPAGGYTLVVQDRGGQFIPLRWPASRLPVHFSIQEETGPELPNVTDDSDPVGALQRALMTWPSVSTITVTIGTTQVESAGLDGVNLISFADTAANRSIFEKAGGATALTMFFYEGSNLTEADVLFNPDTEFTTTIESQEELNDTGLYDVEGQALHELGHAIGLDHTGVEASSMWAIASLAQRQLVADDLAGVRSLYPVGDDYGSIEGTVLVGDAPAFGAQVVAVDSVGRLVSGLTLGDGTYVIENLEPGSYTVYVEPLDGPHGSMPTGDCAQRRSRRDCPLHDPSSQASGDRAAGHRREALQVGLRFR